MPEPRPSLNLAYCTPQEYSEFIAELILLGAEEYSGGQPERTKEGLQNHLMRRLDRIHGGCAGHIEQMHQAYLMGRWQAEIHTEAKTRGWI